MKVSIHPFCLCFGLAIFFFHICMWLGRRLYIPSFELVFSYPSFANVITLVRAGFNLSLVAANFVDLITLIYIIVQRFCGFFSFTSMVPSIALVASSETHSNTTDALLLVLCTFIALACAPPNSEILTIYASHDTWG